MEGSPEEIRDNCCRVVAGFMAKGKRTKRHRPSSPFLGDDSTMATTTSIESAVISSTEEEEDMANCLILLAQSGGDGGMGKIPEVSTKLDLYVYECKTCNRGFPSFQALGGHRASHKKPKLMPQQYMAEPATPAVVIQDVDKEKMHLHKTAVLASPTPLHFPAKAPPPPPPTTTNSTITNIVGRTKPKVHECSICGLEFGSGQALGGHMRRHRATPTGSNSLSVPIGSITITDGSLSRNILPLDLNLPAPEDDGIIDSQFGFGMTQQRRMLFSSPTLVDCHY